MAAGALWAVLATNRAHQVSLDQAAQRLGGAGAGIGVQGPADGRPDPGVYDYRGTGTEHLSLPSLSQQEGPTIPGTVTLAPGGCWVFRVDYSSHHWQTWRYCRHGGDTWEAGGQTWQLWALGPLDVTNTSTFRCAPRTMSLPATAAPGQRWWGRCTGTNTTVSGSTLSAGPYRFVRVTTVMVGGHDVSAAEFERRRTDTGAQRGSERAEVWLDARTGLPVRLQQHLRVTTNTPFGTSTYTQDGVLTLASIAVRR